MQKLIIFSILAIHVFAEKCTEKKPLQLVKGLKMKCVKGQWVPVQRRGGPSGPPCEDDASLSAQGTCSADRGHCSQYTKKGAQMDRDCPGTCDSCDGCRCQDNAQWQIYCPFWAQYCNSPGVLGNWMGQNCRKSCNKCKCRCCSYQGKMHGLNEHIPLPEKCGELVCEEGLVAEASPLLAGAAKHNVSHPEELTLVFHSLFPGAECCVFHADQQDRNNREKMVQEGWSGQLSRNGNTLQATCCHGILCVPLKDGIEIQPEQSPTTTTTATMTTATEAPSPVWRKVYSLNTAGGLFANLEETKKKNIDDPEADLFSILYDLESMRNAEGVFHFKLCYPELAEDFPCNEWTQSSNPLTQQTITGFAGITVTWNTNGITGIGLERFQGLGLSPPSFHRNLIDAAPDHPNRWYSIGSLKHYGLDTVPGPYTIPEHPVKKVELSVLYTPRG